VGGGAGRMGRWRGGEGAGKGQAGHAKAGDQGESGALLVELEI